MSQAERPHRDSASVELSPVMIQVDIPESSDLNAGLDHMLIALRAAGLVIDTTESPCRIGSKASRRYVFRGRATQNAIEHATNELGVVVCPDLEVREP